MPSCPRCKGRMVPERYFDYVRSHQSLRCISCGELLDATIAANRARSHGALIG